MEHELSDAIRKVAVGYSLEEVTEEYGVEDGQVKLLKRKETRKAVPPDLRAVKMLLEGEGDFGSMTDEELFAERERLLKALAEEESGR